MAAGSLDQSNVRAFSLIELLVVVAIIVLLLSIMVPSIQKSRLHARALICQNNLHNIGQAHIAYGMLFDKYLPGAMGMGWNLTDGHLYKLGILTDLDTWICPDDKRPILGLRLRPPYSYTICARSGVKPEDDAKPHARWIQSGFPYIHPRKTTTFKYPYWVLLFGEENSDPRVWPSINDPLFANVDYTDSRHFGNSFIYFLDDHVEEVLPRKVLFYDPDYFSER